MGWISTNDGAMENQHVLGSAGHPAVQVVPGRMSKTLTDGSAFCGLAVPPSRIYGQTSDARLCPLGRSNHELSL